MSASMMPFLREVIIPVMAIPRRAKEESIQKNQLISHRFILLLLDIKALIHMID